MSLPHDQFQIKMLGDRGTCVCEQLAQGYYLKHNDQVPDLQNVTIYHKIILCLS